MAWFGSQFSLGPVQDWELGTMAEFFERIYGFKVLTSTVDRLKWRHDQILSFHYCHGLREPLQLVFGKRVWKTGAPSKVAFFVWTAALNLILATDNLMKRGFRKGLVGVAHASKSRI